MQCYRGGSENGQPAETVLNSGASSSTSGENLSIFSINYSRGMGRENLYMETSQVV